MSVLSQIPLEALAHFSYHEDMMIFLLAAAHLLSPEILDQDMTTKEKKVTGVSKLSNQEKAALQRWIDSRYERRSSPLSQDIDKKHPTLSENLRNGQYVRLSDNTLWRVRPQDVPIVQGWITPAEITVAQSGDSDYPSKLTNTVTGSHIFAKKVARMPAEKIQKSTKP